MSARVLVIGEPGPISTSVLRALWNEGDVCDLAWSGTRWDEVGLTRAARRFHRTPISSNNNVLADALLDRVNSGAYDVVIPVMDWQTWIIVKHAEELKEKAGLLVPDAVAFEQANDKKKTMDVANRLGIPAPRVWDWPNAPDLDYLTEDLTFPVVVKARRGSGVARGVRYAANREQLRQCYAEIESSRARKPTEDFSKPMIMEFIPGFTHDACAIAKDGGVLNVLTQVRQLVSPIDGGVGAVNISTDEPELREMAVKILESLNWNGPAQVEFKYDARDKRYKLIEINPRLWGTLDLSVRAGMNFPAQIRNLILGRPVQRNQAYRVDLRYVFLPRAVGSYIALARTHGLRSLQDRRRYAGTTVGLDFRDPVPELWQLGSGVFRLGRQLLSRVLHTNGSVQPSARETTQAGCLKKEHINTLDRLSDVG